MASSSQKCMHKGKTTPKNKINPYHPGQRGLPRCPGELAAGPPFPFQHSSFVKPPVLTEEGKGRKPEGFQFIYSPAGEQGYFKKLSEFLSYLLTPLRLGIASFLPLGSCSKVPCCTMRCLPNFELCLPLVFINSARPRLDARHAISKHT